MTRHLSSADYQHFLLEIRKFSYIKKCKYRLHLDTLSLISHNFWVFKDCFNKHGYNFNDISKNGYSRTFKIKRFWNKGYDVIISVHHVTNKILSLDSNYTVDVAMWPKFNFIRIYPPKKHFFWGVILVQVQ